MGCCCSFLKKKKTKQDDDLEPLITSDQNDDCGQQIENFDVVEEFANNLITEETYELTCKEYEQRSKDYEMKLSQIKFEMPQQLCLLKDIPNPEIVLASAPIDDEDKKMIRNFVEEAVEALKYFKVEHKEEIIASFPP